MFGAKGAPFTSFDLNTELINNAFWIILAVLLCMPFMKLVERLYVWAGRKSSFTCVCANVMRIVLIASLIVFSSAHLAGDSFNPFLYHAF
jgi:hypothetical protein